MKLIEKPIIKLNTDKMTEMRERIEYVRCVTGHTIPSFSIKLGVRKERMQDIISGDKKPTITLLESISEVFPIVDQNWLLTGLGNSGMTEKNIQPYIHTTEVKDTVDEKLCSRVREIREALGMTQVIFASHLNTTRDVINWVENKKGNPSVILLQRIVEKFKVDDRWILRGIGSIHGSQTRNAGARSKVNA